MSMLPQPPPDAPAPPPSEAEMVSRRKWNWLKGVGIASILISLLSVLIVPMIIRVQKKVNMTVAVHNARRIGLALYEFESEFGKFPDVSTIAAVRAKTATNLDLGNTSSNEFFRQLIAAGLVSSEQMFYAKIGGAWMPDGVTSKGEALKKGECGFTYFVGSKTTDQQDRPVLITPMIPGTNRFDPKRFDGKAIVWRMGGTHAFYQIDRGGHVLIDGRNLMDPYHPIWDGHAPVIAWPE